MGLLFEHNGHIATLTLNRPEAMNAMDPETYKQLSEAWIEVRNNPEIWVAVITGANNPERPPEKQSFTAGADLKKTIPQISDAWHFWQTQEDQILNRGVEVWKPVVAAINGFCLAGGMTLLFATDIRVASEHATFGISEVKRGILPGNGGTQRAIHQLPYPIAMELLLVGDTLTAAQALQFGLVNRVVPHDELMPAAMDLAEKLAANPPWPSVPSRNSLCGASTCTCTMASASNRPFSPSSARPKTPKRARERLRKSGQLSSMEDDGCHISPFLVDLHVHTTGGSADASLRPVQLGPEAGKLGLHGVAVTEHFRVWTEYEVESHAAGSDLLILPGQEYSTSLGHILAFG